MRLFYILVFILFVFLSQVCTAQSDQDLPEGTMAVRGDGSVSRQMFDAKISRIPEKDRAGVLRDVERLKRILADLLLTSQLVAEAETVGFDKGDIQYRMQLAAEKELANAWLDHYVISQPPADYKSMAYEYYLLNKDSLMTEQSRDVTHLLVSNEDRSADEVTELAQSYLTQIKQDPTIFDQLIIEHSDDSSSASNKGHFKNVKKGDMVKPFEDSLFEMKAVGEISGIVQSTYGIHIIRLDGINPSRHYSFEEVQNQLMSRQERIHTDRVRYSYLSELGTMEWQVSDAEIKAMVDRYFGENQLQEDPKEPDSE
jgi:peptidyl-prolyl cis-trans isomerase C